MAQYDKVVITNAGMSLLSEASITSKSITFKGVGVGSGTYTESEDLKAVTALKNQKKVFGISSVSSGSQMVKVRATIDNEGVVTGYHATETCLYASIGNEAQILFAIFVAADGHADYFPPFSEIPTAVTLEAQLQISGSDNVTFLAGSIAGAYATEEDLNDHTEDAQIHVTSTEKQNWNSKAPGVHTHTKSDITDFPTEMKPTAHTHTKSDITDFAHRHTAAEIDAGTFGGQVSAPAGTDYTTSRMRNIVFVTSDPGAGTSSSYANGSIVAVYE